MKPIKKKHIYFTDNLDEAKRICDEKAENQGGKWHVIETEKGYTWVHGIYLKNRPDVNSLYSKEYEFILPRKLRRKIERKLKKK